MMDTPNPHFLTSIGGISSALRAKQISAVELARYYLHRMAAADNMNAFITIDEEHTLAQARDADHRLASGDEASLLCGIPIAHKDLFCTQGLLTTCASKILSEFVAPYDATIVKRLKDCGMVTLGKTNMDEFAMGSSCETSFFGPVKNPWDEQCVPGGSSGGSAAAVAARIAPVASASDTGGSIRQPAAFCGLTGMKPSYGRASRFGMVAFASSLDQAGVLAANAEDAAMVLAAMCGFDERDSTSLDLPVPKFPEAITGDICGLTIGLPQEFFGDGVEPRVGAAIEQAIKELGKLGADFIDVSLPNSQLGIPCYYVIAPAEASSNLSRFDGIRYGYRAEEYDDLNDLYERTRSEGFGAEVKRRIMIGTYVLSSGYYDAYYVKAQKLRRLIADDFDRAFTECDILLGPTTPSTAFAIGAKNDDPVEMYLNDIFTNAVNLAGLPAISIPAGFDDRGLPIGLHLIGKYLDDARVLNVAHQFQQVSDWHTHRPEGC